MTLRGKNILTVEALGETLDLVDGVTNRATSAAIQAENAVKASNVSVIGAANTAADRAAATLTGRIDTAVAQVVSGQNLKGAVDLASQLPGGQPNGTEYTVRDTGTVWRVVDNAWVNTGQGAVPMSALSAATQGAALRKIASSGAALRIDCIGDSLTHGQYEGQPDSQPPDQKPNGETPGQQRAPTPWPTGLQAALGFMYPGRNVEVRNLGFPGDRTTEALARWQNVDRSQTDVAIIMLGTNDQGNYGGFADGPNSLPTYQRNMVALIERYRSAGAAIVLMGPPTIADPTASNRTRAHAEALRMLAERYGAVYVDAAEMLRGLPASDPLYVDGVHLSRQAYALLGWRLASLFGPFGATPPRVGHGSVFRPRNNVWAGRYSLTNSTPQQAVGNQRVRLEVNGVVMVPFDASGPMTPTVRAAAPNGPARLEIIYYGAVTSTPSMAPQVGADAVTVQGQRHEAGRGMLILRALDNPVEVEWVRFDAPIELPAPYTPPRPLGSPYVNLVPSVLAGRAVTQVGSNDWSFLSDSQPEYALTRGERLMMSAALGSAGQSGLMLLSGAVGSVYGFGDGYLLVRVGRALIVRRFNGGAPTDLTTVADVFPEGTWSGIVTMRFTDAGLICGVDGVDRYTIAAPTWASYQPGILAGISADAYAACHALTVV